VMPVAVGAAPRLVRRRALQRREILSCGRMGISDIALISRSEIQDLDIEVIVCPLRNAPAPLRFHIDIH